MARTEKTRIEKARPQRPGTAGARAGKGPHPPPGAEPARYARPARLLHWVMAVFVVGLIPAGLIMANMDSGPLQDRLFVLHESFGALVLVLALVRLGYRLRHPPPPLPPEVPAWQRRAAGAVHALIYAALIAMPLTGWAGTHAFGAPVTIFWLFDLPAFIGKDEALAGRLFSLHLALGLALGGLVVLHAGAALGHRFLRRDTVLARMWPP
ncbi:cytochrome b [Ancylobacter lacus]|uniref:cytochrome b n=1 Tax=Ancylobacter lacus TaxID=2579970 RepID=UPI001BCFF6BE|nr:cytochrome b/b6 domain-containing protein [Ancylobacter lacus]MBS7539193.1 cytochrome b [Ancylobacter lacus]